MLDFPARWKLKALELARTIVEILEEKLAEDILLLDLEGQSDFTDFFVIATGSSERQLGALGSSVTELIKADVTGMAVSEGKPESGWIVLDFGQVVVHLLSPEMRAYYDLEELYKKARTILRMQWDLDCFFYRPNNLMISWACTSGFTFL